MCLSFDLFLTFLILSSILFSCKIMFRHLKRKMCSGSLFYKKVVWSSYTFIQILFDSKIVL